VDVEVGVDERGQASASASATGCATASLIHGSRMRGGIAGPELYRTF
jgi:hypothetical protein